MELPLLKAQVRIHNTITIGSGRVVRKVLSIKASELLPYIDRIRKEANSKFQPERHKKFEGKPILSVFDGYDTGEEFIFDREEDLPQETLLNSKGDEVLIIIPEDDPMVLGINRFDIAKPAK